MSPGSRWACCSALAAGYWASSASSRRGVRCTRSRSCVVRLRHLRSHGRPFRQPSAGVRAAIRPAARARAGGRRCPADAGGSSPAGETPGPRAPAGHRGAADDPLGRLARRCRPADGRGLPGALRGRSGAARTGARAACWPALLGVALIVGAEWLRRREVLRTTSPTRRRRDWPPAGSPVLFGAAYGAGVLYELVPPLAGFALMAAASLIGLAVSLRHGQLVGAVGDRRRLRLARPGADREPVAAGPVRAICCSSPPRRWPSSATRPGSGSAGRPRSPVPSGCCSASPAAPTATSGRRRCSCPLPRRSISALLPRAALDHPIGRRLAWVPCAALGAAGLLLALAVIRAGRHAPAFCCSCH